MQNPARLLLVRHGLTDWNLEGRLQGQYAAEPAPELTPEGREQAAAAAQRIVTGYDGVTALYSSDLKRAVQTANIMKPVLDRHSGAEFDTHSKPGTVPLRVRADLRERGLGDLEGCLIREGAALHPESWAALHSHEGDAKPCGGESDHEFATRARRCLLDVAGQHAGETAVLVTHGGFVTRVYATATGHWRCPKVCNGSITELLVEDGHIALTAFNTGSANGHKAGGGKFG